MSRRDDVKKRRDDLWAKYNPPLPSREAARAERVSIVEKEDGLYVVYPWGSLHPADDATSQLWDELQSVVSRMSPEAIERRFGGLGSGTADHDRKVVLDFCLEVLTGAQDDAVKRMERRTKEIQDVRDSCEIEVDDAE